MPRRINRSTTILLPGLEKDGKMEAKEQINNKVLYTQVSVYSAIFTRMLNQIIRKGDCKRLIHARLTTTANNNLPN